MTETTPADGQEIEAAGEYIAGTLNGETFRVKPLLKWRPSYLRALRQGDFDSWAGGAEDEDGNRPGGAIHEDDVEAFITADAEFGEIAEFTADVMSKTGENPGKSGRPSRPSTRSRRK